jgi:hypothetical protein
MYFSHSSLEHGCVLSPLTVLGHSGPRLDIPHYWFLPAERAHTDQLHVFDAQNIAAAKERNEPARARVFEAHTAALVVFAPVRVDADYRGGGYDLASVGLVRARRPTAGAAGRGATAIAGKHGRIADSAAIVVVGCFHRTELVVIRGVCHSSAMPTKERLS